MEVMIEPTAQRERIDFKGVFAVTPLGDKRCKRTFEGTVKISIPFLGGRIEKYMMEQVRDGYDTAAKVTSSSSKKQKATRRHGVGRFRLPALRRAPQGRQRGVGA